MLQSVCTWSGLEDLGVAVQPCLEKLCRQKIPEFSSVRKETAEIDVFITYLKVVSSTSLQVCFLSLNESTCQTRKNVFYFTSKALFVLEKIKF